MTINVDLLVGGTGACPLKMMNCLNDIFSSRLMLNEELARAYAVKHGISFESFLAVMEKLHKDGHIRQISCTAEKDSDGAMFVRRDGMKLYVHDPSADYGVSLPLVEGKEDEALYMEQVQNWVGEGATIVDAGANIGRFTLFASKVVGPHGMVVSFEPEPANYALLAKSVAANKLANVRTHAAALGPTGIKDVTMYLDNRNLGDHRAWNPGEGNHRKEIKVRSMPLDDMQLLNVNLLKMDTQGSEFGILMGAKHTIARQKRMMILSEYWPHGLIGAGATSEQYESLLKSYGFDRIYLIMEKERQLIRVDKLPTVPSGNQHFWNILCFKG